MLKAGITECFEEFEKMDLLNNCFTECEYSKEESRKAYDNLVQRAVETCEMPQFRDATEHLSIIVRKKK